MSNYQAITAKVRKNPLGPPTINQLGYNLGHVQALALAEHRSDGEHNAAEVMRATGVVQYSAGYTLPLGYSNSDATLATGHNPAVGSLILTLATDRFGTQMVPRVLPTCDGEAPIPAITGVKIISATQVEFFTKALTSGLGGGNAWAAADRTLFTGIHSTPLARGAALPGPLLKARGNHLTEQSTDWNRHVLDVATLRKNLLAGHISSGEHNVEEVARGLALVKFDGTDIDCVYREGLSFTATRIGVGVYDVEFDGLGSSAWCFATPLWSDTDLTSSPAPSPSDCFIVNAGEAQCTDTKVRLCLFKYDFGAETWDLADADVLVTVHAET